MSPHRATSPGPDGDLPAFHQKRDGVVSGIEGVGDYLGAFCQKEALFRVPPVAQLCFCQAGKNVQLGRRKVGYLNDIRHGLAPLSISSVFSRFYRKGREKASCPLREKESVDSEKARKNSGGSGRCNQKKQASFV